MNLILRLVFVSIALLQPVAKADSGRLPFEADPLLSQMEGSWTGEGYRSFPQGDKKVILEAVVRSSIDATGKLVSRNQVSERPSNPIADPTEPKEYVRLYWVKLKRAGTSPDSPRHYSLGYGTGDAVDRPSSEGVFAQNVFTVVQRLGGGYRVDSRTEFLSPDESYYVEKAWSGEELLAETVIRYRRLK